MDILDKGSEKKNTEKINGCKGGRAEGWCDK